MADRFPHTVRRPTGGLSSGQLAGILSLDARSLLRIVTKPLNGVAKRVLGAKATQAVLRAIVSSPLQAALVTWMARTGAGTDASLKMGSLPLPVHFYSPVPDLDDLKRRDLWSRRSDLQGVDFRPDAQVAYLLELGGRHGGECGWPADPTNDPTEFHTENMTFSFGCAAAAHCIIRERKPRRLIEIGSGMSSIVFSAALKRNEDDGVQLATYTVIDPYPSPRLSALPGNRPTVIAQRVEVVDIDVFGQLERGDILFVDSGHVVRIGGDVNFLVLDVLPRLNPGVVVHFHDIGLPSSTRRPMPPTRRSGSSGPRHTSCKRSSPSTASSMCSLRWHI